MASRASAASMRPSWFTQVSEYWPFFQLFLANQARHKPFGGSSDAFRILNEKIPSALNFFFFSLLLFFFLSNLLFFLFSRRRPRIFVSSENDGPSLVKVIGENECTEYTEITYFQPSLRCFQGTRETMASHFLSIPEQQSVCIYFKYRVFLSYWDIFWILIDPFLDLQCEEKTIRKRGISE